MVTQPSGSGAVDAVHGPGGQLHLASSVAATLLPGTGAQGLGWLKLYHQHQKYQQHTQGILDMPNAQPAPTPPQSASLGTAHFCAPSLQLPCQSSCGLTARDDADENIGSGTDPNRAESDKRRALGVVQHATKQRRQSERSKRQPQACPVAQEDTVCWLVCQHH